MHRIRPRGITPLIRFIAMTVPLVTASQLDAQEAGYASIQQDLSGARYQARSSDDDRLVPSIATVNGIAVNGKCDVRMSYVIDGKNNSWNGSTFRSVTGARAEGSNAYLAWNVGAETYYMLDSPAKAKRVAKAMNALIDGCQGPQQSAVKALSLNFEPGDGSGFLHARRGYKRASIKLNYRFLLCANEIQVAYSLDRKSLEHSQDYVDRFVGTNPNFITPPGEPPVPMTVPLALKVYLKKPGSPYVATLRDGTAGEALGMGCFTGQTSKIGLVATLIGPNATRPEIKNYLDLLDLSGMTTAAEIDTPLLNPAVPAPPAPAPRPSVRRKAK